MKVKTQEVRNYLNQMSIALDALRLVIVLIEMSASFVPKMKRLNIRNRKGFHDLVEIDFLGYLDKKMKVVRHEGVSNNIDTCL